MIKTLAEQLMPKYGSTFSKRNLDYFRQFYLCFNNLEIVNTRVHNLTWSHFRSIIKAINAHFSNVAIPHQIAMLEQRTRELKALSIEILNLTKQAKEWLRI